MNLYVPEYYPRFRRIAGRWSRPCCAALALSDAAECDDEAPEAWIEREKEREDAR